MARGSWPSAIKALLPLGYAHCAQCAHLRSFSLAFSRERTRNSSRRLAAQPSFNYPSWITLALGSSERTLIQPGPSSPADNVALLPRSRPDSTLNLFSNTFFRLHLDPPIQTSEIFRRAFFKFLVCYNRPKPSFLLD